MSEPLTASREELPKTWENHAPLLAWLGPELHKVVNIL
jgi:hypothetical protein